MLEYTWLSEQSLVVISRNSVSEKFVRKNIICTSLKRSRIA